MFFSLEAAPPFTAPNALLSSELATVPEFGDPFALLEPIYRRERKGLLLYLGKRAGTDAAPDLLHEVFVRAASSPQVTQLTNPLGFLYRIAHNLLIDRARRRRTRIELLPIIDAHDAPTCATQEHHIEAEDLQVVINRALAALPEKTRRVFVMHRSGGMSYREIQAALGVSLATVEYHMMRALACLRRATQTADLLESTASQMSMSRGCRKNNFKCN